MKRVVTAILKTYLASADVITTVMLIAPLYYIYIYILNIDSFIVYTARIIIMTENIIMLSVSTFVNVYVITLYAIPTIRHSRHFYDTAKLKFNSCETWAYGLKNNNFGIMTCKYYRYYCYRYIIYCMVLNCIPPFEQKPYRYIFKPKVNLKARSFTLNNARRPVLCM